MSVICTERPRLDDLVSETKRAYVSSYLNITYNLFKDTVSENGYHLNIESDFLVYFRFASLSTQRLPLPSPPPHFLSKLEWDGKSTNTGRDLLARKFPRLTQFTYLFA